jgi:hypothetical protein
MGSVTKTFNILVVDPEALKISALKIGANTINVFDSSYFVTVANSLGAATIDFTKYELSDDNFFKLRVTDTGGALTVEEFPYTDIFVSLKGLTSIKLGTFGGTAAVGDTVTATLTFFKKVPWITANTSNSTFEEIGSQSILIRIGANPTPTLSVAAQSGDASDASSGFGTGALRVVTTTNVSNGIVPTITWFNSTGTTIVAAPTGLVIAPGSVATNSVTVTFTAAAADVTAGTYYFKINVGGVNSALLTLVVVP